MNAPSTRTLTKSSRTIHMMVLGAAFVAITGSIAATPARADDDDWRGGWHQQHEWREHEWREHEWREHHQPYAYVAPGYPGYVYAPPPAVYAPPPVVNEAPPPAVYAPQPPAPVMGFDIVFPIHFH